MEKLSLDATPRTVLGKKVKALRRLGQLPANIYGKGLESTAVAVEDKPFRKILKEAGETGLVYVNVDGEEKPRPVLVHGVQRHSVTGLTYHVDFYQVNLKEKTTANVPVVLIGENELEKGGEAMIIQTLNEIEVEALPTDIPHQFEIDIATLSEIGQSVKVSDLEYDREKVEVKIDPEESVLVVQESKHEEEVVEEVVEEGTGLPEVIGEDKGEEVSEEGSEG